MKKTSLFAALMLLSHWVVEAQSPITIEKRNFPLTPGPFHYTVADPQGFTIPKNGQNIAWDYSGLKSDSNIRQVFLLNFHNPFTNSKIALEDTGKQEFLTSDNNYSGNYFYDENDSGFYFSGDYVQEQELSLKNYFNDSTDNIFIPEQNDSLHLSLIRFPATFGTTSRFKASKALRYFWTVNSAHLYSSPSIKRTYYTVVDTVTAWGTLRVPASGKKSIAYPVLLMRQKIISIDSYFVNGSPPSNFFLIAFGIMQGKKNIDCNEYFFRAGHNDPIMTIEFGSDTTYALPVKVFYSTDSIKQQAGISQEQVDNHNFNLFPNPAATDKVNCAITKESAGPWKILILNSKGQVFRSEPINGCGKINMALDISGAKAGMYFVSIQDEYGQLIANDKLSIIR